jgi:hypothetical protein
MFQTVRYIIACAVCVAVVCVCAGYPKSSSGSLVEPQDDIWIQLVD